ncbi:MAG: Transcriptional regulator, ArsR family [Mesotoga prima]|uniref:Transcriptional regulator, ArsR family n=1 Tax=Mesotoga prima TaxID=1184387 RepID=A0A124FYQ3_9BACT|nr:MAG: Transcriptional regulator, ArsR family [Mesotoga prima]
MGQSSGHELARALDLSNFEIGEHIDILREAGMVSVEKMNQMMYFSLNKEAESLKIGRALEDFIEVNEG